MKKHVFLTGEKHIGKTTAIQKFLETRPDLNVDGFCTVRTDQVYSGEISIHILRAGTGELPSPENLLFMRKKTTREEAARRFDALGCAILRTLHDPDLILLDEIGPNEAYAEQFQEEVFRILDGEIPVLGVLQKAESGFLTRISSRPDVQLLELTLQNRDAAPDQIRIRLY